MKKVATTAATLAVLPAPGSTGVGGVVTATELGRASVKAGGAAVCAGSFAGSLAGVTDPGGFVQPAPVPFQIPASAEFVLVDGDPVVLEGDEKVLDVPLVHPVTGAAKTVQMKVYVLLAGQSKMKGE